MFRKVTLCVLCAAVCSAATPEQAAVAFYRWYLHQLAERHEPVLENYVTRNLIARIEKQKASPDGLDADYFLQAQDYLPDWLVHVSAERGSVASARAVTLVALGDTKPYRLTVSLRRQAGIWKIDRVRRLTASRPEP